LVKKCSYTSKEIIKFKKLWKERLKGENVLDFWGMTLEEEVICVPLEMLKEDHLINIIKHIKANLDMYHKNTLQEMKELLQKKLAKKTKAGKVLFGNNK